MIRTDFPRSIGGVVLLSTCLLRASAFAQDTEPEVAQPPVSRPAAGNDPTVPDDAIQTVMAANAQATSPTALPVLRLRAVIVMNDGRCDAMLEIDGSLVRLRNGMTWTTRTGTTLRVTQFSPDGATLECSAPKAELRVEFGNAPQIGASAKPLAVVDFRDLPIDQACRLLADRAGINVVPSRGASALRVSTYLRDVDANDTIHALCEAYQLWFSAQDEPRLLRISTVEEYKRDLTDIQEEETAVFTLNYPNVFDVGYAIRDLFGSRVQLRTNRGQDDLLIDLSDRLTRFDVIDGRTQGFGQNNSFGAASGFGNEFGVGNGGQNNFGGRYGGSYTGLSNQIIDQGSGTGAKPVEKPGLTGTLSAEEILRLEELIAKRSKDEASAADVSKELSRDYEAPIHVTAASRQNKLFVRTSDHAALEQIRELVAEIDVPTALVLLEVRVLSIALEDGKESFFEYQFGNSGDDTQGAFTSGDIAAPDSGLGPGGNGLRAGDLIFQYVDSNFGARLQALETENRVKTLATPILLTANNEVSRLFIGREVPLNRSFVGGQTLVNESTSTTATGATSIEFRPVGTTLLLTPNINSDRSVTIRIVQEESKLDSKAEILVPSGTDFEPETVDVVSSQTVSGTIVAKDDLAVAFGGLIEHGTTADISGVPLLRHIPWLGVLFEQRIERATQREIVIVVKPYVIGTPAEFATRSARALENVGVDLDKLNTDPTTGEVLSPRGPFTDTPRFKVHGVKPRFTQRGSR